MKNKYLYLIICIVQISFIIGCQRIQNESQANNRPQGDFNYSIIGTGNNRTLTITGYSGSDTQVIIPSSIDNIQVTVIGARAFRGSKITSVIIPATITTIRDNAFSDTNLNSVTFLGDMNISNISNTYDMAFGTSTYPFPGNGLSVLYPFRGPGKYVLNNNSWSGPVSNR